MNQFDTWWICTWLSNLTFAPPEHLQLQCFTGEQFVHFHCNVTDPWFSFTSSNQLYDCPRATDHGTKRNFKMPPKTLPANQCLRSYAIFCVDFVATRKNWWRQIKFVKISENRPALHMWMWQKQTKFGQISENLLNKCTSAVKSVEIDLRNKFWPSRAMHALIAPTDDNRRQLGNFFIPIF